MRPFLLAVFTIAGVAFAQARPALTPTSTPASPPGDSQQGAAGVQQALATEQAFVATRRQVTLKEALTLAEQKNPDLQAARTTIAQAAAKTRQALAIALPELSLSASYVHTSVQQEFKAKESARAQGEATVGLVQYIGNTFGFPITEAQAHQAHRAG